MQIVMASKTVVADLNRGEKLDGKNHDIWHYTGATDHIAQDRVGFVEYRRVPAGSRWMRMGNESRVEVLGIGTYKLQLGHIGQDRMTRLAREGLLGPLAKVNLPTCEHCLAGKSTRKPFGKGESFTSAAQDDTEPKSYDEAMSSLACNEWMTAMKNEMKSMRTNQVRELVDLPLGRKSIGNKWVLKIKRKADGSIDKYKARLVAKGYTQRESVDYKETFSPVVRFASIRLILAMVASLDLEFYQMDVKTAFLNRELDEEIFMDQLIGFVVKGQEHPQRPFEEWLSLTFEMKDMGEASFVLDIKILRDRSRKLLGLSQETYIRKVLKRFHMQDCKPIDTPVGKGDSLSSEMCHKTPVEIESVARVPYANAIGKPNVCNVVYVPRHLLCSKADYMLCYQGRDLRLRGYSDADWAGDLDERKSTSGYTFLLGGGAITWCNKKQSCVAHSTMESEYVACSAAVQEAVWLHRFLQRLDVVASAMDPVTIYSDSMATLAYPGEARCEFSQTLKESGLMKNSSRALGVTGLRSVRWKYQDAFMTYAPLRMEEKSTATCDHTICARNDHQIGRQRLDFHFFGMLPRAMDYLILWGMTGRSAELKLSGTRAKGRPSNNTSKSDTCVQNSC
uniref:Uncharacterized protein n=1 Tax=Fagus sylvatica TaxID=28930 RepID=A0A2N9GHN6_FAGSY